MPFIYKRRNPEDEKKLGQALSRALRETGAAGECPPPEDIAALIDGALRGSERDRIMGHLARCKDCYQVFSTASELVKGDRPPAAKLIKMPDRKRRYFVPAAIAASLLLALSAFYFYGRSFFTSAPGTVIATNEKGASTEREIANPPARANSLPKPGHKNKVKEYTPPSSGRMIALLAENAGIKKLNGLADGNQPSTAYGFSGGMSAGKAAFQTGAGLTDLEVALRAGDKGKALDIIPKIMELLKKSGGPDKLIAVYGGMKQKLEDGGSPRNFAGKDDNAERLIKDKNTFLYLRFGEWAEAGRLAAGVHDKAFFKTSDAEYFLKKMDGKGLPQGVTGSLTEIVKIVQQKPLNEKAFKGLEKLFGQLIEMMQ